MGILDREKGMSKCKGKKRAGCTRNFKQFHVTETQCMSQEGKEMKPEQ